MRCESCGAEYTNGVDHCPHRANPFGGGVRPHLGATLVDPVEGLGRELTKQVPRESFAVWTNGGPELFVCQKPGFEHLDLTIPEW